jgi:hypothetical protein
MNPFRIKNMTGRTRNFLIVLAAVIVSGAAYGTITFHQTGTPVEFFDMIFRPEEGESLGFFANLHKSSEVFYYFVLLSFFALIAILSLAIDSNPKAQDQSVSFPKPIRWAISLVVAVVMIFSLGKSGAISRNTAVLLAFPVLIAALVVLFLKRKDI